MNNTSRIQELLRRHRFTFGSEKEFQDQFEQMLQTDGIEYKREFKLSSTDRPDFMVGATAIDLKVRGSIQSHLRQMKRYADNQFVEATVLVVTRQFNAPSSLSNKPFCCIKATIGL